MTNLTDFHKFCLKIADGPPALKTGSETHKQDRVEPNIEATRNRTQNKENLNREIQKDAFGFYVTHSCLKQPCVVNILKTQVISFVLL